MPHGFLSLEKLGKYWPKGWLSSGWPLSLVCSLWLGNLNHLSVPELPFQDETGSHQAVYQESHLERHSQRSEAGGSYFLVSAHHYRGSVWTGVWTEYEHAPTRKQASIPQNIIANLGTHSLKVPQKSWRIQLDGLYSRSGLAIYIFWKCFPKDVVAHNGLSPPTSINPQENPPQVSLSREVPQLRLSSQEILGWTELMVRAA